MYYQFIFSLFILVFIFITYETIKYSKLVIKQKNILALTILIIGFITGFTGIILIYIGYKEQKLI